MCCMKLAQVAHVFLVRWEGLPAQPQPLGPVEVLSMVLTRASSAERLLR